jgi:hypothetical protein
MMPAESPCLPETKPSCSISSFGDLNATPLKTPVSGDDELVTIPQSTQKAL